MYDILLTDAQKALRNEIRTFVKEAVPRQLLLDMDNDLVRYPREFLETAAARNLLGLRFPADYGGRGLGWESELLALQEVGKLGTSLACLYSLPSIVGEAIDHFGTPFQKEKYLKPMLEGRLTCAEALTEPRGGSDFFGTTTIASREGDHYLLNGQKRFVVGAEGADFFLVYARTEPDAAPHEGISTFIVDRGEGVHVEHVYGLMGTRGGGTGRILFRNAPVPEANLVGGENCGSAVFYQMMVPERMTSAGGAIGMADAALQVAMRYSNRRKAFGKLIRRFQDVNTKVAESMTKIDASRALVTFTGRMIDAGENPDRVRRLVSESKKFATESAWEVVNHAMQIMGGIGYTNIYPIERLLRDTRLIMIWTGTNEIMNRLIQHEAYKEYLEQDDPGRDIEADAAEAERNEEKVFE